MTDRFSGKAALITGGTSGIGAAIARALAREGCRVVAAGLTEDEIPGVECVQVDVRDASAVERVCNGFDRLDMLVNCAGIIRREGAEFAPDEFADVVDVNLNGAMRVCVACRAPLAASSGCIVNVASMLSFFGSRHAPAYSSSKGGIVQLTKSLAIAWADDGIRVNAIAPGWIKTPMTEPLYNDEPRSAEIVGRTPLGRWGRPEDVVGAAMFLCSAEAAFVTGVTLPVDGGYSIA